MGVVESNIMEKDEYLSEGAKGDSKQGEPREGEMSTTVGDIKTDKQSEHAHNADGEGSAERKRPGKKASKKGKKASAKLKHPGDAGKCKPESGCSCDSHTNVSKTGRSRSQRSSSSEVGQPDALDGLIQSMSASSRRSPFAMGNLADHLFGSPQFGFGLMSRRGDRSRFSTPLIQPHLVFPDKQEPASSEYFNIQVVHPIDYHRYPGQAPPPKEGPFTEKNKDQDVPGLVVSTVEDTTPKDARGRYITPPYPVTYTCKWCGARNSYMLVCKGCKIARYCRDDCQQQHWAWHRNQCMNDPENAVDVHEGETLEVEIFLDSDDELGNELEDVKDESK